MLTFAASNDPLGLEGLDFLVDPNVAFLLLLIGIIGIAIEAFAPGGLLPGLLGVLAFAAGALGASELTVEPLGVILLVAGIALIIAEAFLPLGVAGAFGIGAVTAAGLTIFDAGPGDPGVETGVIIAISIVLGVIATFVIQRIVAARHNPVLTGHEELPGSVGLVRTALDPVGQVFVGGALWRARVAEGHPPVEIADRVRVESVEGLTLTVVPVDDEGGG